MESDCPWKAVAILNHKDIPLNPPTPNLSTEAVKLLTELCFRHDDKLQPVNLIFLFSTAISYEQAAKEATEIENLIERNITIKVIIAGGLTDNYYSKELGISEAELVMREINQQKYPNRIFFKK